MAPGWRRHLDPGAGGLTLTPLLRVRSVAKSFGGLQAVKQLSLDLEDGGILGIIGPNGAGKSTLFNIISGQLTPDTGEVQLDGQAIAGQSPEATARLGLSKTFQTSRPFGTMTFLENVMVGALSQGGNLAKARAVAGQYLETVGLSAKADVLAAWASTGQRKRLDIARALATRPRLLLLDEPFGGVDLPSVDSLVLLLRRLRAEGVTLVVIEHNLDAVRLLVDRLIAMHLGEKIAEGAPDAVIDDPAVIQAYMGSSEGIHA
jgi:branched-chain amino acid transport system ATP-binding protein